MAVLSIRTGKTQSRWVICKEALIFSHHLIPDVGILSLTSHLADICKPSHFNQSYPGTLYWILRWRSLWSAHPSSHSGMVSKLGCAVKVAQVLMHLSRSSGHCICIGLGARKHHLKSRTWASQTRTGVCRPYSTLHPSGKWARRNTIRSSMKRGSTVLHTVVVPLHRS